MKVIGYNIAKDKKLSDNNLITHCSFKEILKNPDFIDVRLFGK